MWGETNIVSGVWGETNNLIVWGETNIVGSVGRRLTSVLGEQDRRMNRAMLPHTLASSTTSRSAILSY